jgi:hypothetical protein
MNKHSKRPAAGDGGSVLDNADLEQSAPSSKQAHRPQDRTPRPRLVVVDGHDADLDACLPLEKPANLPLSQCNRGAP